MRIIGRTREKDIITQCLKSKRPEFIAIYGRRRIGKTYLIREYFNNRFSFYASGVTNENMAGQLKAFSANLVEYGDENKRAPKDWYEAFARLKALMSKPDVYRESIFDRIIVFLDEIPWMDTPRSDFKSALEHFWNTWASARDDMVLIICGSATTWIIENILQGKKGFHNRVTRQIHLAPFNLKDCEELLEYNDISMPRDQIIESYMVFGGVPYYLNMLDSRFSLAQNIDELCFRPHGELHNEYHNLFYALYKKPENHLSIIAALSEKQSGMTRNEIAKKAGLESGALLTKNLLELEQCGFIRKSANSMNKTRNMIYQLIDPFILFSLRFIAGNGLTSWTSYHGSPAYNSWRGHAFEIVCLNHVPQIKSALRIAGVETQEYAWRSNGNELGAQIDLVIDRRDGVVNLCEMKYSSDAYVTTSDEYKKLQNRINRFAKETGSKKSLHITLVSANGLKQNKYSSVFQNSISGDELFVDG
ncbi:MAG: ATP-binding protein [Eubacterium sp.]|nr:ATP-binding protein [Eubacterium sp.]